MFQVFGKSHPTFCRLAHLSVTWPRCRSVCANVSVCEAIPSASLCAWWWDFSTHMLTELTGSWGRQAGKELSKCSSLRGLTCDSGTLEMLEKSVSDGTRRLLRGGDVCGGHLNQFPGETNKGRAVEDTAQAHHTQSVGPGVFRGCVPEPSCPQTSSKRIFPS